MKQKHYIDIENLREKDTELRIGNGHGFKPGDIISITEKIDGANSCIAYDTETGNLAAFSRKQELTYDNNLSGFWNYAQLLDKKPFADHSSWRVFGEWGVKNKIIYDDRFKKKWIVYSIFDTAAERWLPQDTVKEWCKSYGFEYIHELYYGEFISWDHCRQFCHSPAYGDRQEGIVIRNITRLNDPNSREPFILKIVNDDFKESMKTREKVIDPEVENAKAEAQKIIEAIITKNRIEKELFKMRDEGILPDKIQPSDMRIVAQNLPKRIYDDCMKEERELVLAAGEYFGKMASGYTMRLAKEIILG